MARVVGELIDQFAKQETKSPISVADFLRLLAVFKELDAQRSVKEVRVKWVGREKAA
jgi:hypothetical protein